jgi:hypothetical protein
MFFLMGGFFFGRDMKDVMAGQFIVKVELEEKETAARAVTSMQEREFGKSLSMDTMDFLFGLFFCYPHVYQ